MCENSRIDFHWATFGIKKKSKLSVKGRKTHENRIGKIINATPLLSIVHKDRIGWEEERHTKGGNTTRGI